MKRLCLLGSTGSIGTQALNVVEGLGGEVRPVAMSAHSNGRLLLEQCRAVGVGRACLTDPGVAAEWREGFEEAGVGLLEGHDGLLEMIAEARFDIALNALVGSAGLPATLAVLERGADLALANKESLVAGGDLVTAAADSSGARIIPVDSEHSAVFQCLEGTRCEDVKRVILTASGGAFRDTPVDDLPSVTVEQALAHPTWSMGTKVTIDSATLMNKGLEVIEAYHLFGVGLESIDVVIHPQSIVHSMVEMLDGSVLAQLGVPDMRIPIQYALTYPSRGPSPASSLDLTETAMLTFSRVDPDRYPCLGTAYDAARRGGTCPAVMNAANEEAVEAFLDGRIAFTDISRVVADVVGSHSPGAADTLDAILDAETGARRAARELVGEGGGR